VSDSTRRPRRPAATPAPRETKSVRSLADLGPLKTALEQQQREQAEREARERAERERLERERTLFSRSVGAVQSLPSRGRAELGVVPPPPHPRQRELDEREVLRESISDEFNVETLLDTDEALSFRRPDIGPDVLRKLRRGHWSIQRHIDLHGLRRDEARERISDFLRDAARQGVRCVRVVHGKGNGSPGREPVLKGKVRSWLVQREEVIAFVQASAHEGGAGALIVLLRPSSPDS
jgi:DNA-nicking Smr family endonuclease